MWCVACTRRCRAGKGRARRDRTEQQQQHLKHCRQHLKTLSTYDRSNAATAAITSFSRRRFCSRVSLPPVPELLLVPLPWVELQLDPSPWSRGCAVVNRRFCNNPPTPPCNCNCKKKGGGTKPVSSDSVRCRLTFHRTMQVA